VQLIACIAFLAAICHGQQAGEQKENKNLDLQLEECTGAEDCTPLKTKVTLDSNWRWTHKTGDYQNCYTGNLWDDGLCPDAETCGENCCIDGVDDTDWKGTYGVKTDGKELSLKFITQGPYSTNIGQRLFLLDPSEEQYHIFKLKNREFTMDVDLSELPCGLNGAVYFVEMEPDGGTSKYPSNEAGAAFGTGYCDAQCPHDVKFIAGEPNMEDWEPSEVDVNSGTGHYGACCAELDIWEANSVASAFTVHPCEIEGYYRCEGVECGDNKSDNRYDGVCDKDGCDFHHWRLGDKKYYGPGPEFKVDTTKKMTVVTQFLTDDGTDTGEFVEMRRIYVQDGKIIQNSLTNMDGIDEADSVTAKFCDQMKSAFGDEPDFQEKGGLTNFGPAMDRGMVLVLSLWDDFEAHMLWLDSDYPLDKDPSVPGVSRGPCSRESGKPEELANECPEATVRFSKLRVGTIGSTFAGGDPATTSKPDPTSKPDTTEGNDCPGGSLDQCISGCVIECNNLCF